MLNRVLGGWMTPSIHVLSSAQSSHWSSVLRCRPETEYPRTLPPSPRAPTLGNVPEQVPLRWRTVLPRCASSSPAARRADPAAPTPTRLAGLCERSGGLGCRNGHGPTRHQDCTYGSREYCLFGSAAARERGGRRHAMVCALRYVLRCCRAQPCELPSAGGRAARGLTCFRQVLWPGVPRVRWKWAADHSVPHQQPLPGERAAGGVLDHGSLRGVELPLHVCAAGLREDGLGPPIAGVSFRDWARQLHLTPRPAPTRSRRPSGPRHQPGSGGGA